MRTYNFILSSSATLPSNGTYASSAQKIEFTTGYSVQADYNGAALRGTISLAASNTGVDFVTIPASTAFIDSPGHYLRNVLASNYEWVRFEWASSGGSSSGFVNVTLQSKGF